MRVVVVILIVENIIVGNICITLPNALNEFIIIVLLVDCALIGYFILDKAFWAIMMNSLCI